MRLATSSIARRTAAHEAWALLLELWLRHKNRMADVAAQHGLSPMQAHVLHELGEGSALQMSLLADVLAFDASNVTGIVDRLEQRGLVERRPGERDRRVKMVEVTAKGAQVRDRIRERLSLPPEPLASLSAEDAAALRDILRRALEGSS